MGQLDNSIESNMEFLGDIIDDINIDVNEYPIDDFHHPIGLNSRKFI